MLTVSVVARLEYVGVPGFPGQSPMYFLSTGSDAMRAWFGSGSYRISVLLRESLTTWDGAS